MEVKKSEFKSLYRLQYDISVSHFKVLVMFSSELLEKKNQQMVTTTKTQIKTAKDIMKSIANDKQRNCKSIRSTGEQL